MKQEELLRLAQLRKSDRLRGYAAIGDFHDRAFECDHVSPWTKSAGNVDADIMVVGQDWSSSDILSRVPLNEEVARLGYDPRFRTNTNLDDLLQRHFDLKRAECYLTNLFPYIKYGEADAKIELVDLEYCAKKFTLREIEIVAPRLVIVLGLDASKAIMGASGRKAPANMSEAINTPFRYRGTEIRCVAHTGSRGTSNRGKNQVDEDWAKLAESLRSAGPEQTRWGGQTIQGSPADRV